jgi:hypothetical protein
MTCCIMMSLKYSLRCCTSLKPSLNLDLKTLYKKEIEKELENPEKKKRRKQPSWPSSAQPGRAPAPPDRRVLPRACPPSLARCPVGPTCRRQFPSPAHSLSLPRGPGSPVVEPLLRVSPFLSLHRGPALSVPPSSRSPWTGACTLTHVTRFLGHDARPRAQLPF